MSSENVEVVQAVFDAWMAGDFAAMFKHFHPDVEWAGPATLSHGGTAHGLPGARRAMSTWVGTWDDYRFELTELVDCGSTVFAAGRQTGRGRGSGVEVSEEIFSVWTLRDGLVVRQQTFRDRAQASEAAGVAAG
jgi:ketosteroid isomerase-like protein